MPRRNDKLTSWRSLLVTLAMLQGTAAPAAPGTEFKSGPARVNLLELYSSEGCSSCPPAEAWLTGLRSDPALWRKFVPIAFHVDYWDRLGWAALKNNGSTYQGQVQLAPEAQAHPRSTSLAVWITEAGSSAIVQATGGDLP